MPLTLLPTPPSRADSANFASRADAFFAALPAFQIEFNAMVPTAVAGAVTGSFTVSGNSALGSASTNTVAIQAGSAALPALIPSGDANTGLWFPASDTVAISTAGAERMRADSSGNVGIGGSPSTKFHVLGSAATARVRCSSTDGSGAVVEILADGSSSGVLSVNTTHSLKFQTDAAERARIDATGNLLVGYTSSYGAYKLQVNSQIFATSSTVATSDGNYKTGVESLTGALSVVNALHPVSFEWLPHAVHAFPAGRTTGFIAQEVAAALAGQPYASAIVKSNAVAMPDGTEEQFLGIAEGNLIALLVAAVQELTARVAALEAEGP